VNAKTGNKQWVAHITGEDSKYNFERDFVAYQKPRTSERVDGNIKLEDGMVFETTSYSHSGKNSNRSYLIYDDGEMKKISEEEVYEYL
jgi:hypothetical protein